MHTRFIVSVIASLAILLVQVSVSFAQSTSTRPVVTLSETALNKYIIRIGKEVEKDWVSQTDVNVSFPNGLYVDLWGSTGFDGKENFGREIDITAGWANRHFDFGVSYYKLIPLNDISAGLMDIYAETHHILKFGDHTMTPYVKVDGMIALKDVGDNSGFIGAVGMRHAWQLNKTFSLSQGLEFLYHTPIFHSDSGMEGRYDMAFNIGLSKSIVLSPIVLRVATPISHMHDRKLSEAFGGRVTMTFR